jgi:hypothetical protein
VNRLEVAALMRGDPGLSRMSLIVTAKAVTMAESALLAELWVSEVLLLPAEEATRSSCHFVTSL